MSSELAIERFWDWFSVNEGRLRTMRVPSREDLLDEILKNLQLIDERLYFEISEPFDGINDFVITAEGKRELFPLVDCIIAMAPKLNRWTFTALKPASGFEFSTQYGETTLKPSELWFLPLSSREDGSQSAKIGLRIGIPKLEEKDAKEALCAAFVLLDTAIGEREMANAVGHVEVVSLPEHPRDCGYTELLGFREFLDQRERKSN